MGFPLSQELTWHGLALGLVNTKKIHSWEKSMFFAGASSKVLTTSTNNVPPLNLFYLQQDKFDQK